MGKEKELPLVMAYKENSVATESRQRPGEEAVTTYLFFSRATCEPHFVSPRGKVAPHPTSPEQKFSQV